MRGVAYPVGERKLCLLIRNPGCSELRSQDVEQFVWYYNHQRPHLSLRGLTPVQRRQTYFAQTPV